MTEKTELWRSRYIRLLTESVPAWSKPESKFSEEDKLDLAAIADLVDAGYMRGQAIRNEEDDVVSTVTNGPTLAGRLFAEDQKAVQFRNSLKGRILSGASLFIGWLSGVLSALLVYFLTG